jgi:hypothetical protein
LLYYTYPDMKKLWLVVLTITVLILTSCGRGSENSMNLSPESDELSSNALKESGGTPADEVNRKLIKTGDLSFKTDDLDATGKRVKEAIRKHKAWISSENENTSGRQINRMVTIRVPADRFDAMIADIGAGVERFDQKNISSNDVTEEFLDVEARLKNRKALEIRYLELLSKASTTADLLQIENQINMLRGEIESIEGRMKYLSNQVDYSTLTVNYYKEVPVQSHLWKKIEQGLQNGWTALMYVIILIATLWPFLLIGLLAYYGIRIYLKKKRKTNLHP